MTKASKESRMKKTSKSTKAKTKKPAKKATNIEILPAIDEIHYMKAGDTIRLERDNIVRSSFVSNKPVKVNYEKATIMAMFDADDEVEVCVSYLYRAKENRQ